MVNFGNTKISTDYTQKFPRKLLHTYLFCLFCIDIPPSPPTCFLQVDIPTDGPNHAPIYINCKDMAKAYITQLISCVHEPTVDSRIKPPDTEISML